MNLTAILQRDYAANDKVTFGKLYLPWLRVQPDLYTIELPWKDNKPKISCIPEGIYTLKPYTSIKHVNVWEFQKVPERKYCLIHPANYACDVHVGNIVHKNELEGCVAVGFGIDEDIPMITRSRDAMNYLRTTVGTKTTWQLQIRN